MDTQTPLSSDDPRLIAWNLYKASEAFQNTRKWATYPENVDGSLWAAFLAGYAAALDALGKEEKKG